MISEFNTLDNTWNVAKLANFLPHRLVQKISAMPLPFNDVLDSFCWGFLRNGDFARKSVTWIVHELVTKCATLKIQLDLKLNIM